MFNKRAYEFLKQALPLLIVYNINRIIAHRRAVYGLAGRVILNVEVYVLAIDPGERPYFIPGYPFINFHSFPFWGGCPPSVAVVVSKCGLIFRGELLQDGEKIFDLPQAMDAISARIPINTAIVVTDKGLHVYQHGGMASVALDLPRIAVFQKAADSIISHKVPLSARLMAGSAAGRFIP
jgi:hypothetical protein